MRHFDSIHDKNMFRPKRFSWIVPAFDPARFKMIPYMQSAGATLYFVAATSDPGDTEMWKTDGGGDGFSGFGSFAAVSLLLSRLRNQRRRQVLLCLGQAVRTRPSPLCGAS